MSDLVTRKSRELVGSGKFREAEQFLRQHMRRAPADLSLHAELARVFAVAGNREQAIYFAEHAGQSRDMPTLEAAGDALSLLGEHARAADLFRRAIARTPDAAPAHNGLGVRLMRARRFDEAREPLERAHALAPGDPNISANLALAYAETWSVEEALELLRAARRELPSSTVVQHQIPFLANYSDRLTSRQVFDEHRRFAELLAARPAPTPKFPLKTVGPADADRALHVGLVSADFREHSVSRFLEAILCDHDPGQVRFTLYPVERAADETTARLREWADAASDAALRPEPEALNAIRREGPDVLMDLAGLTRGMRANLLIARAAPLQITYLGYPNTTAFPGVDARIVDSITDPPGPADALATERLIRLDPCFVCFSPAAAARECPPRGPAVPGPVTFGSFNALAKITATTLDLWCEALRRTSDSTLLIKAAGVASPGVRSRLVRAFEDRGIAPSRLELVPYTESLAEHYRLYQRIDIALDTFPYHGTTTTCEALFMGVPVVSLVGDRHASRVGASLLAAVGEPGLAALSAQAFVNTAINLAEDPKRRSLMHATLRARLAASALGDTAAFGGRFATALRAAWRSVVSPRV